MIFITTHTTHEKNSMKRIALFEKGYRVIPCDECDRHLKSNDGLIQHKIDKHELDCYICCHRQCHVKNIRYGGFEYDACLKCRRSLTWGMLVIATTAKGCNAELPVDIRKMIFNFTFMGMLKEGAKRFYDMHG